MNYADKNQIANLKASADLIEEVSDLVTYLGFCASGTTGTDQPTWSVLKITQSGTVQPILTSFLWADGKCSYNKVWNDRAGYTYTYKKF